MRSGHFPHQIGGIDEVGIRLRLGQPDEDGVQAEVGRSIGAELFRCDHQGIDGGIDAVVIVRRENEIAALFDERAGQRLGERALRQGELDRIAQTLVAAFVLGRENHGHLRARPRTFGEIGGRLRLAEAAAAGRQSKRHLRRIDEGAAGHRLAVDHGLRKIGLGAGHAVVVVDLVTQRQRAAHVRLRLADEGDDRRPVGNRNDVVSGEDTAVATHDEAAVAVQCPAFLAAAGGGGSHRLRTIGSRGLARLRRLESTAGFNRHAGAG